MTIGVIEQCKGCQRVTDIGVCNTYANPPAAWRRGKCPFHPSARADSIDNRFVNPLKASKRKARGNK